MNSATPSRPTPPLTALSRFWRKPKGQLAAILVLLIALPRTDSVYWIAPTTIYAALAAMVVDAPLLRLLKGRWIFPSGSLLTGMIVAMILSRREPWYVVPATAALAVISKFVIRGKTANIFNPAALALLVNYTVFNPGEDWWGAQSANPAIALLVLVVTGAYMANRVNRLPVLLWFLGSYFLLFTVTAFIGNPRKVAEIYRAPDIYMLLFFAFFMVTDPPTSPHRERDQRTFGIIVAGVSFTVFELFGPAWFLLAGLLSANAWEGWRRSDQGVRGNRLSPKRQATRIAE